MSLVCPDFIEQNINSIEKLYDEWRFRKFGIMMITLKELPQRRLNRQRWKKDEERTEIRRRPVSEWSHWGPFDIDRCIYTRKSRAVWQSSRHLAVLSYSTWKQRNRSTCTSCTRTVHFLFDFSLRIWAFKSIQVHKNR